MRRVIAMRKQDARERAEFEAVLDTYLHALGMEGGGLLDPVRAEAAEQAKPKKTARKKQAEPA